MNSNIFKKPSSIIIKDHKKVLKILECKLLNPIKKQIGFTILENIYNTLRRTFELNQWIYRKPVINLFRNKSKCVFNQFDMEYFYPSITEELLKNILEKAQFVSINDKDTF